MQPHPVPHPCRPVRQQPQVARRVRLLHRDDPVGVAHRLLREELQYRRDVQGDVVAQHRHPREQLGRRHAPADPDAGQAVALGERPERDAPVVPDGRRQRGRRVGQLAEGVVPHQPGARLGGDRDQLALLLRGHRDTGGVVREVDDDHPRPVRRERAQRRQVGGEPVVAAQSPARDPAAERAGDVVQLLVRGVDDDDLVAGFEHRVHDDVDRLAGAVRHHHPADVTAGPPVGQRRPQRPAAEALAVVEHHRVQLGQLEAADRAQFLDGHIAHAAAADVVVDVVVVQPHPLLEPRDRDLHAPHYRMRVRDTGVARTRDRCRPAASEYGRRGESTARSRR